jgi:hypothetical protein
LKVLKTKLYRMSVSSLSLAAPLPPLLRRVAAVLCHFNDFRPFLMAGGGGSSDWWNILWNCIYVKMKSMAC